MTAPVLSQKKFWIVNPKAATNQIKNPTFASPDFEEDWTAIGAGVTIEETGSEQRWGAYSMKVNPANNTSSGAYHGGLTVANTLAYTFSCYVKGVAGQAMRILISDGADAVKATTQFTATGYWQRVEVTHTAAENAATYRAKVLRDAVASTAAYYVDGAQFEQASKASTFFDGYTAGCHWTGTIRNSPSARSDNTGLGGELVDLEDYCHVVQVTGLGHGDWNQIMTKMTSGGDMYQTHIRKSRQFSIVVDFIGSTLGEIEAKRDALINILRPDLLSNLPVNEQFGINMPSSYRGHEQRIIRYQGVDVNGVEATNPIDIICVPMPATLTETPDLPTHQRAVLNFAIPSGLLQGAYQEGKVLDLYANFPAEFIVKRDPQGNWCKWTGSAYASLITGLNGAVYCMAEGPDGKIYVGGNFTDAGGVAEADYLARWNPKTEAWESVVSGINSSIYRMVFDANGDLYIGGGFTNLGSKDGDYIVKVTDLNGTPTVNALGTGLNSECWAIVVSPDGNVFVGGLFTSAGSVLNTSHIAKWDGAAWSALSTGLNDNVLALAIAPNGDLYVGGSFINAAYPYLCKWNGTALSVVGTNIDINDSVYSLAFGAGGYLYVGGVFTNAGGVASADYIAKWSGSKWESLGTGTNSPVYDIFVNSGKVYASGAFTTAGGLTLTDRVAVWSNGAWQPLDIDLPGTSYVYSILPASDGSLYIGGNYSTTVAGENAKTGIVALNFEVASASANTYPVISVTGPGTLKSIINYRTGKSVMFDGLTLQAGEWISLNFDPLQLSFRSGWASRGNLMRYVIAGSDYGDFYVSPGANYLSIFMDGTTTASKASITYVPKFWGLDGALL
jgi:WD40 repeat protein